MKDSLSLPGNRTDVRRQERQKAQRLARVLEAMTASVLQHMAERQQSTGRFYWDGLTGEFATSSLISTLELGSDDGCISAQARLRNDEWMLSISVNLPDYALRGFYDRLHALLNLLSYSNIEMAAVTLH